MTLLAYRIKTNKSSVNFKEYKTIILGKVSIPDDQYKYILYLKLLIKDIIR